MTRRKKANAPKSDPVSRVERDGMTYAVCYQSKLAVVASDNPEADKWRIFDKCFCEIGKVTSRELYEQVTR